MTLAWRFEQIHCHQSLISWFPMLPNMFFCLSIFFHTSETLLGIHWSLRRKLISSCAYVKPIQNRLKAPKISHVLTLPPRRCKHVLHRCLSLYFSLSLHESVLPCHFTKAPLEWEVITLDTKEARLSDPTLECWKDRKSFSAVWFSHTITVRYFSGAHCIIYGMII